MPSTRALSARILARWLRFPILTENRTAALTDEQRAPIARAVPMARVASPKKVVDGATPRKTCAFDGGVTATMMASDGGASYVRRIPADAGDAGALSLVKISP